MRTRIEIPDDLFRKAKAQAALEGMQLRDLIERGLRLVLAEPATFAPRQVNFPLHRSRRPGALLARDVRRAEEQIQRDEDASRVDLQAPRHTAAQCTGHSHGGYADAYH
jgi:hypothetical protein